MSPLFLLPPDPLAVSSLTPYIVILSRCWEESIPRVSYNSWGNWRGRSTWKSLWTPQVISSEVVGVERYRKVFHLLHYPQNYSGSCCPKDIPPQELVLTSAFTPSLQFESQTDKPRKKSPQYISKQSTVYII